MIQLNIITVWYNEASNLPKLFDSLISLKSVLNVKHIYIDQTSQDVSLEIARSYWCDVHLHQNRWYADPDKKWAHDNLCKDNEWVLILDADEELSNDLSLEIIDVVTNSTDFDIYKVGVSTLFLWITSGTFHQMRFFRKGSIDMSDKIHNFVTPFPAKRIAHLKNSIINNDLKNIWRELYSQVEKENRYSEFELNSIKNDKLSILIWMFFYPFIWMMWWGIRYGLFIKWIPGFIYSLRMAIYQFTIYSKAYERYITTPNKDSTTNK